MASPRPSPPSRPRRQTPQNPDAQHPLPNRTPRPPAAPLSAHVRPRQGRLRRRCAGATRPLTRPGRSHEPAAIGNREQTRSRPGPSHHDRQTRETTTCRTGPVQVSPWCWARPVCLSALRNEVVLIRRRQDGSVGPQYPARGNVMPPSGAGVNVASRTRPDQDRSSRPPSRPRRRRKVRRPTSSRRRTCGDRKPRPRSDQPDRRRCHGPSGVPDG